MASHASQTSFSRHFRVGHQALSVGNQFFKQALGLRLVGVRRANKIHRDVGVNQNHGCEPAIYPASISASMRSRSPTGYSHCAARRTFSSFFPILPLAVVYSEFEKKRGKPLIGKKFRKQRAYCPL